MQYTDNEAALIGGLISNYFLRPAVSAALKDSYTRVLEHLRTGRVSAADLKQIQKALAFLTPTCQMSREAQRDLMGASLKTTALLSSCRGLQKPQIVKNAAGLRSGSIFSIQKRAPRRALLADETGHIRNLRMQRKSWMQSS